MRDGLDTRQRPLSPCPGPLPGIIWWNAALEQGCPLRFSAATGAVCSSCTVFILNPTTAILRQYRGRGSATSFRSRPHIRMCACTRSRSARRQRCVACSACCIGSGDGIGARLLQRRYSRCHTSAHDAPPHPSVATHHLRCQHQHQHQHTHTQPILLLPLSCSVSSCSLRRNLVQQACRAAVAGCRCDGA